MGDFLAREPARVGTRHSWRTKMTTAEEALQAICSTDVAIEAFQEVIAQIESSNRCVYAMTIREIIGRRGDCTEQGFRKSPTRSTLPSSEASCDRRCLSPAACTTGRGCWNTRSRAPARRPAAAVFARDVIGRRRAVARPGFRRRARVVAFRLYPLKGSYVASFALVTCGVCRPCIPLGCRKPERGAPEGACSPRQNSARVEPSPP